MKTQYYTASSLDGFIATEDDSLEWLFPLGDVNDTSYPAFIKDVGALAMGSSTYEWMLRHLVKPGTPDEAPWPYEQPTWVFSSRPLQPIKGAAIRFARGDVRLVHEQMKEAADGRNIWVVGGGELVGQFYDAGLLDEIIVQVGSVTLARYMNIREITPADIPALFHVRPRTRENALTIEELRALDITPESVATRLAGSTRGWLCETAAGEVVGFCMADRSSGELLVIAMLPEYEGHGIGGRLMQRAEHWLAQGGWTSAWLTTDLDPTLRAYGFYRHRGWTDWKLERGLRWMQLAIPPGRA